MEEKNGEQVKKIERNKEDNEWVKEKGIFDGSRPKDPITRQEVWIMLQNLSKEMK